MKKSFSLKGISFLMVFVLLMSLFPALGHGGVAMEGRLGSREFRFI